MKKLNLGTAIYSLVASILFLFAPLFTLGAIVSDVAADATSGGASLGMDGFFRTMAGIMLALAIILLVKDRTASTAGKILLIIGGAIIILFSSLLGFVGGVVGIVGASLLLASNKKYNSANL